MRLGKKSHLDTTGKVYGGEHEHAIQTSIQLNFPTLRPDLRNRNITMADNIRQNKKSSPALDDNIHTSEMRPTTRSPTSGLYLIMWGKREHRKGLMFKKHEDTSISMFSR